jgi:ribosomal protein S25
MGGSKNKSPAQKEKKQKKGGAEDKKTDKSHKEKRVVHDTININESKAANYIKNSKVITIHGLARETNVKISIANTYIKKSVQDGILKRTSGFSGHRIYQPVSK